MSFYVHEVLHLYFNSNKTYNPQISTLTVIFLLKNSNATPISHYHGVCMLYYLLRLHLFKTTQSLLQRSNRNRHLLLFVHLKHAQATTIYLIELCVLIL
jgi:hypothetical protein